MPVENLFLCLWKQTVINNQLIVVGMYLYKGIGDSGQGWANCIMFCFLTERVRGRMRKACLSCLCCQCICDATGEEQQPLNVNGNDGMKSIYSRVDDSAHFEHSLQETGKV